MTTIEVFVDEDGVPYHYADHHRATFEVLETNGDIITILMPPDAACFWPGKDDVPSWNVHVSQVLEPEAEVSAPDMHCAHCGHANDPAEWDPGLVPGDNIACSKCGECFDLTAATGEECSDTHLTTVK